MVLQVYIQNKTAQLLSLVFVVDYPARWPSFIADLLSMLQLGPQAVNLYLKILLAIDAEVIYIFILFYFDLFKLL